MKALRFLLPALFGCLFASAADRELTGSVVDANTGEPIARAHLTIRFIQAGQPAPELTMLSDADGTFKITHMPDGQYQVSCEKAGYLGANQMTAGMPPTVPPGGKQSATMVLRLTAQAAVEGIVIDDRDLPAANTFIQLVHQSVLNGRRQSQVAGGASTDETGYFRIFGLTAGSYYVSIMARVPSSKQLKPMAYPHLYYPGALDMATAQPLELKAGDDTAIKLRLPAPVPSFEVRGVIVTDSQNAGVNLVRQPPDSTYEQFQGEAAFDAKTKSFKITHVTPGTYLLTAAVPREGKSTSFATALVTVGSSDVTGLRLEPVEAGLDGTVRMEGEAAPPKWSGFISAQGERYSNGGQVDAEGKFHIPSIQPGTYRIVPQIYNAQQSCVRSVLSGGHDVRDGLTVTPGVAPEPVEVVLTSHCGSVDVSVAPSDSPLPPNPMVFLLRKSGEELALEKQGGYQGQRTGDGTPHFLVQGVAAGEYMLYVWPQDLAIEYTNAEYMKQFASYGQKVTVTEDGKSTVTVDRVLVKLGN